MDWLENLKQDWNCLGFVANCKKRKEIDKFIFSGKEYNLHQDSSHQYRIHRENEKILSEVSSYQNLIIEREKRMLSYGYFTRAEIISKRSEQIQSLLNLVVTIDESVYKERKKGDWELALGFSDYKRIDFSVLERY